MAEEMQAGGESDKRPLQRPVLEVVELTPALRGAAVDVLAAAFLDDPAWVGIGPRRAAARLRLLRRYYDILVGEALRWGGPHHCALTAGTVVGVALTYDDGRQFPPPWATVREAPPFVLAGPGPGLRSAYVDHVMKGAHPHDPHLLLWYLAAHPDLQRQGVGRALMQTVVADAESHELPIYLDTTKRENVDYYGSFGFRPTGDARLPRGARVWFLRRAYPGSRPVRP
jgi:GNAT superfamily N-acetyltransferase